MGQHKTPRGEESTYRAHGGKQTTPYEGRHRKPEVKGVELKGKISDRIRKGDGGDWQHESERDSQ